MFCNNVGIQHQTLIVYVPCIETIVWLLTFVTSFIVSATNLVEPITSLLAFKTYT
jgi:hypothetical protein